MASAATKRLALIGGAVAVVGGAFAVSAIVVPNRPGSAACGMPQAV